MQDVPGRDEDELARRDGRLRADGGRAGASEQPDGAADADADTGADADADPDTDAGAASERATEQGAGSARDGGTNEDLEELRRRVDEEYDFDDFGPSDMAEMDAREWEAAFDPDAWITGEALLDRVEAELNHRVATRDVFAVVERVEHEGEPRVLAYTDSGYALVEPDGSVEGFGTVLRDAKPIVALCSMDSYEVAEPPEADHLLPHPEEVPEASDELGNRMLQVVAAVHLLAGLVLSVAGLYLVATNLFGAPAVGAATGASGSAAAVTIAVGLVFVVVGLFLFATVANARLSDTFRAEEYRERLRRMGLEDGERPEFLPVEEPARELTEEDRGDA